MALYATNAYATKAYSEHPLALWALDDDVTYFSLLSEEDRYMGSSYWAPYSTNATVTEYTQPINRPFQDSVVSKVVPTAQGDEILFISEQVFTSERPYNEVLGSFSINFWIYANATSLSLRSYEFGYQYRNPNSGIYVTVAQEEVVITPTLWQRFQYTFDPPENTGIRLYLKININPDYVPGPSEDLYFLFNGMSLGQWSETTASSSLGAFSEPVPADLEAALNILPSEDIQVSKAFPYGLSTGNGYYLSEEGQFLGVNYGIPLVYGSDNVTKLRPSPSGRPSIVFPGNGVLNESGRSNVYTVEMWLRIDNNGVESKRIWGPVRPYESSDYTAPLDGLYINENCLVLAIGQNISSFYIAEWYRPMLVHIILRNNGASVLINGEQVISLSYDSQSINLPGSEYDWIGFYSYPDIELFELDCFSIYPYAMPADVCKRRFVWGQGVVSPETINTAYEGTTAYIDYPFAQYTANHSYPDVAKWDAGYYENMLSTSRGISVPNYSLPQIFLGGGRNLAELYEANKRNQTVDVPTNISLKPSVENSPDIPEFENFSYMFFQNMNILNSTMRGIYGIFDCESVPELPLPDAVYPLLTFTNTDLNHRISAAIIQNEAGDGIDLIYAYVIDIQGGIVLNNIEIFKRIPLELNTPFFAGIDITQLYNVRFSILRNVSIANFFKNPSSVTIHIAGLSTLTEQGTFYRDTLDGKIYRVGIYDNQSYSTVSRTARLEYYQVFGNLCIAIMDTDHGFIAGDQVTITDTDIDANGQTINGTYTILDVTDPKTILFNIVHQDTAGFIYSDQGIASSTYFDSNGFGTIDLGSGNIYDEIVSYTLTPSINFDRFFLDIGVSGYWEDYVPMTNFSTLIPSPTGGDVYSVGVMQLNADIPTAYSLEWLDKYGDPWTYFDLNQKYVLPTIKTYADLALDFGTYLLLRTQNAGYQKTYNFSNSSVRTYISFQDIRYSQIQSLKQLGVSYSIPENAVLEPYTFPQQTYAAFEVKDGTVIYPPSNIPIVYTTVVMHINFKIKGIFSNPVDIRRMYLFSKVFDYQSGQDFVGTKFGEKLYPYTKTDLYQIVSARTPFAMYRDSTPYLYLTSKSGIECRIDSESNLEHGVSMLINKNKNPVSTVYAIQLWLRYSKEGFPEVAQQLFSVEHGSGIVRFMIEKDGESNRGRIFAIDTRSVGESTTLTYVQNGFTVKNPYIVQNEWNAITVNFSNPLTFNGITGTINMNSGAVFDNISYYQASLIGSQSEFFYRQWTDVARTLGVDLDWFYWQDPAEWEDPSWFNVQFAAAASVAFAVNPTSVYSIYTGTNRSVVDDGTGISVKNVNSDIYLYNDIELGTNSNWTFPSRPTQG